jgi:hypothetical protein
MTKGELRKQRQTASAIQQAERLAVGDTRTARQRHADTIVASGKRDKAERRRATRLSRTRTPIFGSAEWAETRGDDLGESPDF